MISSSFLMKEKRGDNVAGKRRAYALRTFTGSVSTSAPRGAATMVKSKCVSGQRLNANNFRMILTKDDTEKYGGYQGKIMSLSGAGGIRWLSEAGEPDFQPWRQNAVANCLILWYIF
jgi:hypothetical protein